MSQIRPTAETQPAGSATRPCAGGPAGPSPTTPPEPVGRIAMALIVACFVLVGHAWSVDTGLVLDDHGHYANLRKSDWSFRSAVESSRLGIIGDVLDLWGRSEAGLRFFRPVAFWMMKLEYTLAGWRPMPMHFFSLGWHYLCAMLVGALAMRCFGRRTWATVAASLAAIHPGHTATVYWIACQTELITTAFLLVGVLAYSRYAGWGCTGQTVRPWFLGHADGRTTPAPSQPMWLGLVAIACYGLALGCRENAVLFPLVCWAGDRLCGSNRRRRFRWEHVGMLALLAGYLVLRSRILGGFPMPVRPYMVPPSDPGFAGFIVEKTVYYTIGLFGFVPVIPMAGQAFFADRPVVFYGGFAAVLAVLAVIWRAYRFRPALLWPALWVALLIAPVMPVFASSHHLYLPGGGAVLLLTAGLAALGGLIQEPACAGRGQRIVCGTVLALHAVGLSLLTWGSGFAYRAGTRSEDILIREVVQSGRDIRDGDHLFFINMPVLAYYAVPAIEAQTDRKNLHGHLLTFSPYLLKMELPGELEFLGPRQIRVRAPAGRRYFEGVTGQSLLEAMGLPGPLPDGQPIPAGLFTVTPSGVSHEGIEEFVFTFDRPIDSPEYHFFFGSPQFLAYPLEALRPRTVETQPSGS